MFASVHGAPAQTPSFRHTTRAKPSFFIRFHLSEASAKTGNFSCERWGLQLSLIAVGFVFGKDSNFRFAREGSIMEIVGGILAIAGLLAAVVGGLWMMVEAFKTSVLWGLAYIFIPFASLIWLVTHWEEGKRPFLIGLAGGILIFCGMMMTGTTIQSVTPH